MGGSHQSSSKDEWKERNLIKVGFRVFEKTMLEFKFCFLNLSILVKEANLTF